jgi:nitric oxide reductase subunit C
LCAFAIQTFLVYSDDVGREQAPLSLSAQEGQKLWLSHNCQVCHQIYGFGGFLGPDLTNVAKRIAPHRLSSILTEGSLQMPAYHFNIHEQESLLDFFKAIDTTGQGTPRLTTKDSPEDSSNPIEHFHTSVLKIAEQLATPLDEKEEKGLQLMQTYSCLSCHLPNTKSVYQAPDLTDVVAHRHDDEIRKILVEGRVDKGMPPLSLTESDQNSVLAFLKWLHQHRHGVLELYHNRTEIPFLVFIKTIPWFEYE